MDRGRPQLPPIFWVMGRQAGTAALLSAAATVAVCVLLLCGPCGCGRQRLPARGPPLRAPASAAARAREASRAQISRRASAELEDPLSTQDASID